jgi:hypothetical protein
LKLFQKDLQPLNKLHYDPTTGYTSVTKLYKKAKEIDLQNIMKLVKEFLDKQATHQITQQVKQNKEYSTIVRPSY